MIDLPSSKSITHRALICAALASGKSVLLNPLVCDDTLTTCDVLEKLGVRIEKSARAWIVHGSNFKTTVKKLNCNESGTTYRFITALTHFLKIDCEITGADSLLRRPIRPLLAAIQNNSSEILLPGDTTSQFLSGVLLSAPLSDKPVTIKLTTPLISKPYVEITLDVQKKFGVKIKTKKDFSEFYVTPQKYHPTEMKIEKDWSATAFFIAAGLLSKPLTLTNLNQKSLQADRAIETIAKEMGGKLEWSGDDLNIFPSKLRAIEWDIKDSPDLFPIVSVLNACAEGKGKLTGIENLKFKESNRLEAMQKLFQNPNVIDSTDHRIIMAGAVLGLAHKQTPKTLHPLCVSKSFPDFWTAFNKIRA